jgi:pyruvate dehydrogenase E1 component
MERVPALHLEALAALRSLAQEGAVPAATVQRAIEKYGIDPEKPNPMTN